MKYDVKPYKIVLEMLLDIFSLKKKIQFEKIVSILSLDKYKKKVKLKTSFFKVDENRYILTGKSFF